MPATSQAQQKLFGMAYAYTKGKLKNAPKKVKDIAKHMSEEDIRHFAATKSKGLPAKKASNPLDYMFVRGFLSRIAEG